MKNKKIIIKFVWIFTISFILTELLEYMKSHDFHTVITDGITAGDGNHETFSIKNILSYIVIKIIYVSIVYHLLVLY
jgi:hypothetical protein